MKKHYSTDENKILCNQRHKNRILATSKFSYKVEEKVNCKNCDKILIEKAKLINYKCISFQELGYNTICHWRNDSICNCIDGCSFKRQIL